MPFGTRDIKNAPQYSSGYMFLVDYPFASVTAASVSITANDIGWTQGSKISNESEPYKERDDSGKFPINTSTITDVTIEGTFLERNVDVRKLSKSGGETFYSLIIYGQKIGTKREVKFFPKVTFDKAEAYEFGTKGKVEYKLHSFAPDVDTQITILTPLPTIWTATTKTFLCPAGTFYFDDDVA